MRLVGEPGCAELLRMLEGHRLAGWFGHKRDHALPNTPGHMCLGACMREHVSGRGAHHTVEVPKQESSMQTSEVIKVHATQHPNAGNVQPHHVTRLSIQHHIKKNICLPKMCHIQSAPRSSRACNMCENK